MSTLRPKHYPHRPPLYAYTRRGFDLQVRPWLLGRGFRSVEVDWLCRLYFHEGAELARFRNRDGIYVNERRFGLYYLSRMARYDRKRRLFQLVADSHLFWMYADGDGHIQGFRSPVPDTLPGRGQIIMHL